MTLRVVSVLALEPLSLFEFGVAAEIFGIDRTDDGCPPFDLRVCALDPDRPVRTRHTAPVQVLASHGLDGLTGTDLVIVGPTSPGAVPEPALDALRAAYDVGATLLAMSTGSAVLAAAGLLNGRRCATHWRHAAELALAYPAIEVDADRLYVDEGRIITSAGTAAGIDACLHLVRRELGAAVAAHIARRMVVPPQREGGQRQFDESPVPECQAVQLAPLLDYLNAHLDKQHTTASMAGRAAMSTRTFARRFLAETGVTPHQWLIRQRVLAARGLLEETDLPIDEVARRVGFSSPVLLRTHFHTIIGTTPTAYRRRFASPMN